MSSQRQIAYPLAHQWWSDGGPDSLVIRDESGQRLLVVPMTFLAAGHVKTFGYILDRLNDSFEQAGSLRFENEVVSAGQVVRSGQALFVRDDGIAESCTPRKGPRFKYKFRSPTEGEETSTMSNSKRSTKNQAQFRVALIARDGACLLSNESYQACTACHILPQSRPEYYEEVLGFQIDYLFLPAYGLLLQDDLHHAFDKGEIALLPVGDQYIVHIFSLDRPGLRQYHGKIIGPDRFRFSPKNSFPHTGLLNFHYRQCTMKYLRGFSFDM